MIHPGRLPTRGRVTLSKALRDSRLGLRPGMKLAWEGSDGQDVAGIVVRCDEPDQAR
jgi:hypothetical protein